MRRVLELGQQPQTLSATTSPSKHAAQCHADPDVSHIMGLNGKLEKHFDVSECIRPQTNAGAYTRVSANVIEQLTLQERKHCSYQQAKL